MLIALMTDSAKSSTTSRWLLTAVVLLAVVLRGGVLIRQSKLDEDRDGYLALSEQMAEGNGYVSSVTGHPTAFRPPLYPLLLAGNTLVNGGSAGIGLLHLMLAAATVWFTWKTARELNLTRWAAIVAALLVAVDPLLVLYSGFAMTETLFACCLAALLFALSKTATNNSHRNWFLSGLVFGCAALCRPSIWGFGVGSFGLFVAMQIYQRAISKCWLRCVVLCAGVLVPVLPWTIRNVVHFDKPIFTTTHGGYTLLLGNNPVFFDEVVAGPWGTVWQGESLAAWQSKLHADLAAAGLVGDEVAADRWHYERATQNIRQNPPLFVRACWLKLRRFWSPVPVGTARTGISNVVLTAVLSFYLGIYLCAIVALFRGFGKRLWLCVFLLLSFSAIHSFYWSNARMRGPLMPALAVLAVAGISPKRPVTLTESADV